MNTIPIIGILLLVTVIVLPPEASAKSWTMYVDKMPEHWKPKFGNLLYDATKYWEQRIPGTYFYETTQREKSDFVVQWSSQFEGTKLGYYTPNTNNDYGRPYIAITLGFMTGEGLNKKFELVDSGYALEITKHEIGHAIGLKHSADKNDIMYPTIHNYDDWLSLNSVKVVGDASALFGKDSISELLDSVAKPYQSQSRSLQNTVNQSIESTKTWIYEKQDHLESLSFASPNAQYELDKAKNALNEAKTYLAHAQWTQKEGELYISNNQYEKAFFKYEYSKKMIEKSEPLISEIDNLVQDANEHERLFLENKILEAKMAESKTCFLFWCW